jgi:HD-like signal output (HDOD) protein
MTDMPTLQANPESRRAAWTLHMAGGRPEDFSAPEDMRRRIASLDRLPPLPEMARRILALKTDPYSDARKLADIVELDPPLAAQLLRWAGSPLYGFQRKPVNVKDAIVLAVGFERAFELAFALCSLAPLQAPVEGPLGKRFFWRQTLAGSLLLQRLAHRASPAEGIDAAELHLLYLLHNTGHLLLAHLFRHDFDRLVRIAEANPKAPLHSLERYVLDVDHCQLGAWLMQSWNMSERLRTVVQHHHNPRYRGEHERLVWLTCLTDRLLGHIGVGDAQKTRWNDACLLENLGIAEDAALACLQAVEERLPQLDGAVAGLI